VKSLTESWISYEKEVVPADAPVVQREECYRAFMAGAAAARKLLADGADLQPEISAFFERMNRIARAQAATTLVFDARGGQA